MRSTVLDTENIIVIRAANIEQGGAEQTINKQRYQAVVSARQVN